MFEVINQAWLLTITSPTTPCSPTVKAREIHSATPAACTVRHILLLLHFLTERVTGCQMKCSFDSAPPAVCINRAWRQQRFSKPSPQGTIEVAFLEMAGAVLELYQLPAGTPFDAPRCGIDHLALEVSDLDAVQQRLAALGYPLDEGPIEEDNVRFLLIRGPDGERLEFDACKR